MTLARDRRDLPNVPFRVRENRDSKKIGMRWRELCECVTTLITRRDAMPSVLRFECVISYTSSNTQNIGARGFFVASTLCTRLICRSFIWFRTRKRSSEYNNVRIRRGKRFTSLKLRCCPYPAQRGAAPICCRRICECRVCL